LKYRVVVVILRLRLGSNKICAMETVSELKSFNVLSWFFHFHQKTEQDPSALITASYSQRQTALAFVQMDP
jgi:hypothetical protein